MREACIVVTGAAGGIGGAVASKLLAAGEHVVVADREAERLEARYGGLPAACPVACDLATDEGLAALESAVKARFVGVKGFVHAAGADAMAPLGMITGEAMERLFRIHAICPVRFLGWMAKKPNRVPGAAAVLISSMAAHEGAKGHVAYAAAEGAVEGFLKPAAAELAEKGVRLNAVVLGVVETEMSKEWMGRLSPEQVAGLRAAYPFGLGTPGHAADAICFLLSPAAAWISGQTLVCDGGHSL